MLSSSSSCLNNTGSPEKTSNPCIPITTRVYIFSLQKKNPRTPLLFYFCCCSSARPCELVVVFSKKSISCLTWDLTKKNLSSPIISIGCKTLNCKITHLFYYRSRRSWSTAAASHIFFFDLCTRTWPEIRERMNPRVRKKRCTRATVSVKALWFEEPARVELLCSMHLSEKRKGARDLKITSKVFCFLGNFVYITQK